MSATIISAIVAGNIGTLTPGKQLPDSAINTSIAAKRITFYDIDFWPIFSLYFTVFDLLKISGYGRVKDLGWN